MKLGDDDRVYPDRNPWPRTARELSLDPTTLTDRVRELAELAPDTFADVTATPQVSFAIVRGSSREVNQSGDSNSNRGRPGLRGISPSRHLDASPSDASDCVAEIAPIGLFPQRICGCCADLPSTV
jgi:hypothetical protein